MCFLFRVYPPGHWFGKITPSNLSSTILPLLNQTASSVAQRTVDTSFPWSHWRGRSGVTREEMEWEWRKATRTWDRSFYQGKTLYWLQKGSASEDVSNVSPFKCLLDFACDFHPLH